MYGIKAQRDNVGHEAHLGGALAGMLLAISDGLLEPRPRLIMEQLAGIQAIQSEAFPVLVGVV